MAVKGVIARICYDLGRTRLRAPGGGWRHGALSTPRVALALAMRAGL
jgi:hypothetical protein